MAEERISTYDIQRLLEYYQHSCRQPSRLPWHRAVDLIALQADVGPFTVKISKFREFCRTLTEDSRYRRAAWWWLHPHNPCYGLEHLSSIQQNAALDHVERGTFLRRLSDFCVEQQRKHGKLYGWIANRLALLEYELSPPATYRSNCETPSETCVFLATRPSTSCGKKCKQPPPRPKRFRRTR